MVDIYLDNNATTPMDPEVVQAMEPYMITMFGNPSSLHKKGVEADQALMNARHTFADILNIQSEEVIFTSGATESINTVIKGLAHRNARTGKHIITTAVEHECVRETCRVLEAEGYEIDYVKTDKYGFVSVQQIIDLLRDDTVLVAVMEVNNELGTIYPVEDIAREVKQINSDIYVVVDGAQGFGKLSIDLTYIDAYTISAHKLHGPKGIGALVLKTSAQRRIDPLITGGGQEFGCRSGTQNVPGIVGFAKAVDIAYPQKDSVYQHLQTLHTTLRYICGTIDNVVINSPEDALPTTCNVSFIGIPSETLLHALEQHNIIASSGSACSRNTAVVSHVLDHVTNRDDIKHSVIRFGLSRMTTQADIEYVGTILQRIVPDLR